MTLHAVPSFEGTPAEPDWNLIYFEPKDGEMAHEQWRIIICEMQSAGTLSVANGHAIRRLVEFRIQYERSIQVVAKLGTIIAAPRTKTPQISPHWTIVRQADDAIRILEAELGISPVRRSRAGKLSRAKITERTSDRYLAIATRPLS